MITSNDVISKCCQCIDGNCEFIKSLLNEQSGEMNENRLQMINESVERILETSKGLNDLFGVCSII